MTRDDLCAKLKTANGGRLTRYLEDLEECGFIRKYLPVGGKNGGTYQLIDNFSQFFMEFVQGNPSREGDYWTAMLSEGRKNEWRGKAFERLCLEHVPQIKKALGISGVHTEVYLWSRAATAAVRGSQVNLLIDRRDGLINLCEMKYASAEFAITKSEFEKIERRIEAFREVIGAERTIQLTLVTVRGLKPNVYRNDVQAEIVLDDLFAP